LAVEAIGQAVIKVVGHRRVLDLLARDVGEHRAAQSYLLVGPQGVGKHMVGLWLAQTLNCMDDGDARPCGACRSCRKIAQGKHPDVTLVEIEEGKTTISIEQVRNCIQDLHLGPFEGNYKIYVFTRAERMDPRAADAMLKLLEEPPGQAILILLTTGVSFLPPTVVSRCRTVRLGLLSKEEVEEFLRGNEEVDPQRIPILVTLAEGRPGRALELNQEDGAWKVRTLTIEALLGLPTMNHADALNLADSWSRVKAAKRGLAEYRNLIWEVMLHWFRDLALARLAGEKASLYTIDHSAVIFEQAESFSDWQLETAVRVILEAKKQAEQNVNWKLLLQGLFMRLADLWDGRA